MPKKRPHLPATTVRGQASCKEFRDDGRAEALIDEASQGLEAAALAGHTQGRVVRNLPRISTTRRQDLAPKTVAFS